MLLRYGSILVCLLLLGSMGCGPKESDTAKTQKTSDNGGDDMGTTPPAMTPPAMDAPAMTPPAMDAPAMTPPAMDAPMSEPPERVSKTAPKRPKSHARAAFKKCTNCHKIGGGVKAMPTSHKGRSGKSCKGCHQLSK